MAPRTDDERAHRVGTTSYGTVQLDVHKSVPEKPRGFASRRIGQLFIGVIAACILLAAAAFFELELGADEVQSLEAASQLNVEIFKNDILDQRNDCACIWQELEEDGGCSKFDKVRKTHMCQVAVDDPEHPCMGIDYRPADHDDDSGAWWAACSLNQGRFQCWNFPCMNGGFCIDGVDDYECVCKYDDAGQRSLFEGENCEHEIDECILMGEDQVCHDAAFCLNAEGKYSCECESGFQGSGYSETLPLPSWVTLGSMRLGCTDIDDCESSPCYHEGHCEDDGQIPNHFDCTCPIGWEGPQCNRDVNECAVGSATCDSITRASCINTDGSFLCECSEGWAGDGYLAFDPRKSGKGKGREGNSERRSSSVTVTGRIGCADFDDCASSPCLHGGSCFDHGDGTGTFDCECVSGWLGDECEVDENECLDADIMAWAHNNCHADAFCLNTPGSYMCHCNEGWTGDGYECSDADDCEFTPCNNGGSCHDCGTLCLICDCAAGWHGETCDVDWDECFMGIHSCHDYAVCANTPGSFDCACEPGFSGDGFNFCSDVDDCVTFLPGPDADPLMYDDDVIRADATGKLVHPCGLYDKGADIMEEHGVCRDLGPAHFICSCDPGWTDALCDFDVDECARETHSCDRMASCTNSAGSFSCDCNLGFTGDGTSCHDIDDCATRDTTCKFGTCVDLGPISHRCICDPGWGQGGCDWDIDECSERSHSCGDGAKCHNTDGSYECRCPDGWEGDALSVTGCEEIDDCAVSPCNNGACTDHGVDAFVCDCDPAWTDTLCDYDVNECFLGTHDCHETAKCVNSPGSFYCRCLSGFQGDGYPCVDIDDCDPDPCDPLHGACVDKGANDYVCVCEVGFCEENCNGNCNECTMGTHECHVDAQCTDTFGSYVCTCAKDFYGDGEHCGECTPCKPGYKEDDTLPPCNTEDRTCVDVNECAEMLDNCDEHADCENTPGSFTCACSIADFWTGDGTVDHCHECHECPDGYHEVSECKSTADRVCEPDLVDGIYVIESTAGGTDQCLIFNKGEGSEQEYPSLYNFGYSDEWCGVGDWNGKSHVQNLVEQEVAVFRVKRLVPWKGDYNMVRHNLYTVESRAGLTEYRCLGFADGDQTYPARATFGPNHEYCGQTAKQGEDALEMLLTGAGAGFVWKLSPIGEPRYMRFTMETMARGNRDSDSEDALNDPDDWECLFFSRGGTSTSPSRPLKRDALFGHGDVDSNGYTECGISMTEGAPDQAEALLQNKQAVFRLRLLQADGGSLLPDLLPARIGGWQTSAFNAATWANNHKAELNAKEFMVAASEASEREHWSG